MLRIRLQRVGTRNQPHYRIVVADRRSAAKKGALAVIGQYRPDRHPKFLILDKESTKLWLSKGAQPTDTIHNLLVDLGLLKTKRNIKYARAKVVEEAPAAAPVAKAEVVADAPAPEPAVEPATASDTKE